MQFTIPGPFTDQTPFTSMHAWQWAKTQPRDKVSIHDYLDSLGFVVGRDRLTEDQYRTLDHMIDTFHRVAPHLPGRMTFADAFAPAPLSGFYVQGMQGLHMPCPLILTALQHAGWIYDVKPETTYFQITNGVLWAKYQQILGSRPIVEIAR